MCSDHRAQGKIRIGFLVCNHIYRSIGLWLDDANITAVFHDSYVHALIYIHMLYHAGGMT